MKRKTNYSKDELSKINKGRQPKFQLDSSNEDFLRKFNKLLSDNTDYFDLDIEEPSMPVMFVVGLPRSGSSLLYQTLVDTGEFGYISNFSSRFWGDPYVGLMMEKILQIRDTEKSLSYQSEFGKTNDGLFSPHEFMYFWDKWFARGQEVQEVPSNLLKEIDIAKFRKEVAKIENIFSKPLIFKSQFWLSLQIKFLHKAFPNSLILYIDRNPLYIAQSIAMARKQIHNDLDTWWSLKPKEFRTLKDMKWSDQIMGQVYFTKKRINELLEDIPDDMIIRTSYYELCDTPDILINKINNYYSNCISNFDISSHKPPTFKTSDTQKLQDNEFQSLIDSYKTFYKVNPEI